jgi:hypothetical protein
MLTSSYVGTKVATIQLPKDEERWRRRDEKGDDSNDGFNGQHHPGYGFDGQERLKFGVQGEMS